MKLDAPDRADDAESSPVSSSKPTLVARIKWSILGPARDLHDASLFHRLSLVPFLAWVGLGADGLSSSSYGPDESFRTLGQYTSLALGLAVLTAFTVFVIAAAYSRIIERFPQGGGGYLVASTLLGARAGVVSGSALLVDYVLTITVSLAAAVDALFSMVPPAFHAWALPCKIALVLGMTLLNLRGVRESVLALTPIFIVFLATHVLLIVGGLAAKLADFSATVQHASLNFHDCLTQLGLMGTIGVFAHAYSLGGGTYTGLEAVSNGLPIMREPRVATARRTMTYMAASLSFMAAGLMVSYLVWRIVPIHGKTMNAALLERVVQGIPMGIAFVAIALISEGALLAVGAQAGFIDGPRVLANMALDSWLPRSFTALSERLTTQNGILVMGCASLLALLHTRGNVSRLMVMYSINVFLTFSISMFGMSLASLRPRETDPGRLRRSALFIIGFLLCATILIMTIVTKFEEGGWLTVAVTSAVVGLCFLIKAHYRSVGSRLAVAYAALENLPLTPVEEARQLDPSLPTAGVLVGSYGGAGIHTVLQVLRAFPHHFRNIVFVSAGILDSGSFKGEGAVEQISARARDDIRRYVELAEGLGLAAEGRWSVGTDTVDELERLCLGVARDYPELTFFAGKVVFPNERWYHRLLHNNTALSLLLRLQDAGKTLVILPTRIGAVTASAAAAAIKPPPA